MQTQNLYIYISPIIKSIFDNVKKEKCLKTCLLLSLVQISCWDSLFRIEDTKLVCAISMNFLLEKHNCVASGVLKWS